MAWQGNQLQLAARTATETETEICQTARTIKTGPRAVDLISVFLHIVSPQRFYIFIIFFSLIAILAADFVTAENATHARFYGSPPLYFLAFSPFRLFFLAFFFWQQRKTCTLHLPQAAQQSSLPAGVSEPRAKGKNCNCSNDNGSCGCNLFHNHCT